MNFDPQGHVCVTPKEVHKELIENPALLIHRVLLWGTPNAIPTHDQFCQLLEYLAEGLGVHPKNFLFRGSTKIGFSIAPKADKIWMEYGPASDLDLAIVDASFFNLVDGQVRQWERNADNRRSLFRNPKYLQAYSRRIQQKGKFECHRCFDLPPVPLLQDLNRCLDGVPIRNVCGIPRGISAFVFRDWWGVYQRYDFDLYDLRRRLSDATNPLPPGEDVPRSYVEPASN